MKTSHKIALAKLLYRAVHGARSLVGKSDVGVVTRNGNRYELNLAEGIDLAVYLGMYEPSTARALARLIRPGARVLDIGANVGVHTVHMARLVGPRGRVFAFEPTTFAFEKMKRNLQINPGLQQRVVATQCFLGRADFAPAPISVYAGWPLRGGTDLHPKHLGQPKSTDGIPSRTLDALLQEYGNPAIALVKLDVDGYECDVLAGSRRMRERDKPVFVMELAPYVLEEHGTSLDELLAYFTPLGYRFYEERCAGRSMSTEEILRATGDGSSVNVIARAD